MTTEVNRSVVRSIVRGVYQIQKLRVQMGNRIVANLKVKLGQEPSQSEADMDAEGKKILTQLRASYEKITDGASKLPKLGKFEGDGLISEYEELVLVSQYIKLEKSEEDDFKRLGDVLKGYPIWTEYLSKVRGIGPAMAGVLISEIDIHKCHYPSSLHCYAGLDVHVPTNQGRSRRKEHLRDQEYVTAKGEIATKLSITYNPFLKSKLIGVIGSSFLKAKHPKYSVEYYNYKNRLDNHPEHKDKSKGHKHAMATRRIVKFFLTDLYTAWRELEDLDVFEPYGPAKLGIRHWDPQAMEAYNATQKPDMSGD